MTCFEQATCTSCETPDRKRSTSTGLVTGNMGFHEFVVIDRAAERLHVIVASDD